MSADNEPKLPPDSDFQSANLSFAMTNTTTKTSVKKSDTVRLIELMERGMVLEVPPRTCSKGHKLLLVVKVAGLQGKSFAFTTTATVDEIESLPDGVDHIVVTLTQYDEREWIQFQNSFSSRQQDIENFFKAAKGY